MEPHYGTVSVCSSRFREVLLCCNAYRCAGGRHASWRTFHASGGSLPIGDVAEARVCKSTSPDLTWLSSASAVEKAIQKAERQEGKKHAMLYRASSMLVLVSSMHINMVSSSLALCHRCTITSASSVDACLRSSSTARKATYTGASIVTMSLV